MAETYIQLNANVTEEDKAAVQTMMVEDGLDNQSGFIRMLIRQEKARRYSQPNHGVSLSDALETVEG